jgi:hypothetical protein
MLKFPGPNRRPRRTLVEGPIHGRRPDSRMMAHRKPRCSQRFRTVEIAPGVDWSVRSLQCRGPNFVDMRNRMFTPLRVVL